MRDAADAIQAAVGARAAEEIDADALRRSALLWHLTVFGEAASQVSGEAWEAHPEIAWKPATRMRNRIARGYWDIDVETLVATAVDDLPQMIEDRQLVIDAQAGDRPATADG